MHVLRPEDMTQITRMLLARDPTRCVEECYQCRKAWNAKRHGRHAKSSFSCSCIWSDGELLQFPVLGNFSLLFCTAVKMDVLHNFYVDIFGGQKIGLIDSSRESLYGTSNFRPHPVVAVDQKLTRRHSRRFGNSVQPALLEVRSFILSLVLSLTSILTSQPLIQRGRAARYTHSHIRPCPLPS